MKTSTFFILLSSLFFVASVFAEPEINQPAPDFSLKDAKGKTHKLSDYRGKTVVLEWINPQCPFVVRHYKAKTMTTLATIYSNKNIVWLAVDSTHHNTPQRSQKWTKKHQIPYPILQDPSGKVGQLYAAKTTPHMYVIDPEGKLRYKGAIDNDTWGMKKENKLVNYVDKALNALLGGATPAYVETKPYGCSVKYK